ncbi:pilus assembly PilX N-terminal domain-containing protein [uncultured Propionivibrio sp.]|uniref:pilus assembly PilX N-terminal domain-containing protein n=1 Tax=uncultured Propionivibrio sp. TaxID=426737 RepID=UPI0029C05B60|nr:pilus assembly PilX N-terminal domain-containing protein [uncultured Propionivibrio sp.]
MAIVSALFLLIVLAVLGAAIAKVSSMASVGESYDADGAKAYQAARAGVEWAAYQLLKGACSGGDYCALCRSASYASPTTRTLGGLSGDLSPFSVTVSCASGGSSFSEAGSAVWVYRITVNACNQPTAEPACPNTTGAAIASLGYSERQISLTVSN